MHKRSKTGLTLIELLIVITIIGLLAAAFGINVSKWRARARDSQRVSDIRTIQQGLAFYYLRSDYSGAYPAYAGYITGSDSLSQELINANAMSAVPSDPLSAYGYYYCSYELDGNCPGSPIPAGTNQPDGTTYTLIFYLETGNVPDRVQGWNTATP